MKTERISGIIREIWAVIMLVVMSITGMYNPTPADTAGAELVHTYQYVLTDAFAAGQGITSDGEYYYTSGAISALYLASLSKIDIKTGEIVKQELSALPDSFRKKGYDHIGDLSYYNGMLYCPVEDRAEQFPLVLLFDAESLEYTGICYELDGSVLTDGIPWCTVDADNGYLYTGVFHNAGAIQVYNLSDMTFSHEIVLSESVDRVQGGDYLDGVLYLNCDPHDTNKLVYGVDVATGETELLFDRNTTGFDCEAEGICVTKDAGGSLTFNITDYDKTVAVFIRSYKLAA